MTNQIFNMEFNDLTTKFLFLNCKKGNLNHSNINEISILLNDLNSLDYEKHKIIDKTAAIRLIDSILNIVPTEDILIMKACCLMSVLVNKQNICLSEQQMDLTIEWLLRCLDSKSEAGSIILIILSIIFKNHLLLACKYFQKLLAPDGSLINLLNATIISKTNKAYIDGSNEENLANILICIDSLLIFTTDESLDISITNQEIIIFLGSKMISLLCNNKLFSEGSSQCMTYLSSAINVLQKVAFYDIDWCEQNIGDLLGIAKQYIHYGIFQTNHLSPKKILPSQQSVEESDSIPNSHKGGKILKKRKPRRLVKNRKQDLKAKDKKLSECMDNTIYEKSINLDRLRGNLVFNKTSDSDFSESEAGRIQSDRRRQATIRLNAISLVAAIVENVDKKIFFSYWYCLLPFEEQNSKNFEKNYGIFSCAVRDSNPKCRLAALQVISHLLYGSKIFLMQAENNEKSSSSFTPFAVTLGNTIVSMFQLLTHAAENENSLPVLTQVLKCLAVLIQATPFSRLKTGFVTECINNIRKLVYHKDITIQVAALMVMEFFISTSEITAEISECVGMPKSQTKIIKNENKLNDSGAEEIIEIEYYDEQEIFDNKILETPTHKTHKIPWLLEKVIQNLESKDNKWKKIFTATAVPVRIECLQVLTAMVSHILFFKDHLESVSSALKICLKDDQNEIRLHAARCLDTLGHSINTFLLSNCASNEILNCQNFWTSVLPCVTEKIQDSKQSSTLKSILCDFLSNIGVHIYERSSHQQQMMLISFLTGISYNENIIVRAAAVRALAVYVMFPSLRDDLCFVENTSSLIVELLKEKNSFVRVKTSWSLGNISDALIPQSTDSKLDRISDDLLKKMFEIAIELANDNDKVKCNVVRTIGNLLRLIRIELVTSIQWRFLCLRAVEKLTHCLVKGSNAKVKWNACYAVGNFMKNINLFTDYDDFNWQSIVFAAICDVIINNPNFKVRINGVIAITAINNRDRYGHYFILLWSSLLTSMEQSDNLTDFNEYKHRDSLQEQLCFTLCHMIKIATKEDFLQMKTKVINLELIKMIWKRVINRITPENASNLINCPLYLRSALEKSELNVEQRSAILVLLNCFVSPNDI